ncbi:MAG: serine/threonine protein kinase [Planctomycetota bacterium]|jgi:serine/threonine-protein kinase
MPDDLSCPDCSSKIDSGSDLKKGIVTCRKCGKTIILDNSIIDNKADRQLAEELISKGLVTRHQIEEAFKEQEKTVETGGVPLASVLLEKKFLRKGSLEDILGPDRTQNLINIPGYRVLAKLGEGGMGNVYKAIRLSDQTDVAVKVLSGKLARRKEIVARFKREAKVAISLDHPHIVKGYEAGEHNGTHFFAMEYIHGKSAERVLNKRKKFGEKRSIDIVRQIAEALQVGSNAGLVHRDIKPGNIILTREGYAKLADYGLVKITDDEDMQSLTLTGQVMGTPYYISPEQAAGESDIDIRCDIYSLGATLYHMATGTPPYRGRSGADIMAMHICGQLEVPSKRNPELTGKADALIMKMMAKDRAERFQTPEELLDTVHAYFDVSQRDNLTHQAGDLVDEEEFSGSSDFRLATIMSEWFSTPASRFFDEKLGREKKLLAFLLLGLVFFGLTLGQGLALLRKKPAVKEEFPAAELLTAVELCKISALNDSGQKTAELNAFLETNTFYQAELPGRAEYEKTVFSESLKGNESTAVERFVRAGFYPRDKKLRAFKDIISRYPDTETRKKAEAGVKAIEGEIEKEEQQRTRAAEQRIKSAERRIAIQQRVKLERQAGAELASIMLIRRVPDKFREKLQAYLKKNEFSKTNAYRKAQRELTAVTRKIEEEDKKKKLAINVEKANQEFRSVKQNWIFALMEGKADKARNLAMDFAEKFDHSQARKQITPLVFDSNLLLSFERRTVDVLAEKAGSNISLKMKGEGTIKGRLLSLNADEGKFKIKLKSGPEVSRRIATIAIEEKYDLLRSAAKTKKQKINSEVIVALSLLTQKKTAEAEKIFNQIKRADPYAAHHRDVIKEFKSFNMNK